MTVFQIGTKQFLVKVGDKLHIDKIKNEVGEIVKFDQVVYQSTDSTYKVGEPFISGAVVEGKVISHGKGRKIHVLKYKNKSKYRRKIGHRQQYTEIEILKA